MKFLLFALAALILQVQMSFAQTPKNEQVPIDQQLGITKSEPARPTSGDQLKDQALRYYKDCIKSTKTVFRKETHQLQCGCIANTMIETMQPSHILALYEDNDTGRKAREIFFTRIHGACAKYPVYDHVMAKCMTNRGFQKSMLRKHRDVCECTADTAARFINHRSTEKMIDQLTRTPDSQDPVTDFVQGYEFTSMHNIYMRRCVNIHIIDPP